MGIVVDDAIVVGENIYEYRQKGYSFMDAAILGAKDVAKPVVFSVLTTIIAFVPLLFIPGETGKYWWPLPVVVIVVLAVSLFEALFILPSHVAHKPKQNSNQAIWKLEGWQESIAGAFNRFVHRFYRPFLDLCLRNRYITLSAALALLLLVGGFGYSDHMGMVLMPEVAADEIEAAVRLPVGTTTEQAAKVATEITNSTQRMFDEHNLKGTSKNSFYCRKIFVSEQMNTFLFLNFKFLEVPFMKERKVSRPMFGEKTSSMWRW